MRVRSATWIFSAQVIGLLISFPMSILLARVLGPEGKGMLSVVQQVGVMGASLFNFGLGSAFIYYGARREARGGDVVRLSASVAALVAAVLVGVFALGGVPVAKALLHDPRVALMLVGALAVFPVLLSQLLNCFVVGSGAIRNASLVNTGALLLQLIAYAVLWGLGRLDAVSALAVWLSVTSLAMLVWIGLSLAYRESKADPGVGALFRRVYRYGLVSWVAGSLGYAALRQDMFLLAFFKGPAAVGVYSVAVTLAELCWYIPSSLITVLTPKVAGEPEEGLAITLRLSRMTWPVTMLTAGVFWFAALLIVPLLYGRQYAGSLVPLALILPGVVAYSIAGIPSSYLMGTGHPMDGTIGSATNVLVNLVANIVLIPRMGAAGAALASTISYGAMAVVMLVLFTRRTHASLSEALVPRGEETAQLVRAALSALKQRLSSGGQPPEVTS